MNRGNNSGKMAANIFAKNINDLMKKYHTPKTALAEATGYSVVAVSRYLNRKTVKIPIDFAVNVADFFELTITDLLETKNI